MSNAISIKAKLYNLAKENGLDFQNIVIRYFHEKILYRISLSPHRDNLILKGGNWMYAIQGIYSRPTTDIDLLARTMSNEMYVIISIFEVILSIDAQDGITFIVEDMKAVIIAEQKQYHGVRLSLVGRLDSIRQSIMINIGFGDVITPEAILIDFPTMLDNKQIPSVWAYNAETVIAEKFHAMVSLGSINSRMKDVFDIYTLLTSHTLNKAMLKNAIHNTFRTRNTSLDSNPIVFSSQYKNDLNKEKQWQQYHKKIRNNSEVTFANAIDIIEMKLKIFLVL